MGKFVLAAAWLLACGTVTTADDPAPVAVPQKTLDAVKGVLPKGWSATAKGDTLTVRREKVVGVYNPIGLPPGPLAPNAIFPETYEITLKFRAKVTAEAYERMRKENIEIDKKLEARHETMRAAKISHKFDDWLPETPGQKQLVAEYRQAQKAMPYHRLPDLYSDTHSIDADDSLNNFDLIADPDQAKECRKTRDAVEGLFKRYKAER